MRQQRRRTRQPYRSIISISGSVYSLALIAGVGFKHRGGSAQAFGGLQKNNVRDNNNPPCHEPACRHKTAQQQQRKRASYSANIHTRQYYPPTGHGHHSFETLVALHKLQETSTDQHQHSDSHTDEVTLSSDDEVEAEDDEDDSTTTLTANTLIHRRRIILHSLLASSSSILALPTLTSANTVPAAADATTTPTTTTTTTTPNYYYIPETLDLDQDHQDTTPVRQDRISVQRATVKNTSSLQTQTSINIRKKKTKAVTNPDNNNGLGILLWSAALWLLAGSRSNPLVKPLANAIYHQQDTLQNDTTTNSQLQDWLQDRNNGLFTPLPPTFLFLLGTIFLLLGLVTDQAILLLTDGDSNVNLQLAGVSLIGGAALELGRVASGEKLKTRQDVERDNKLQSEFQDFTEKRLIVGQGGSLHRSEVVRAFRKFYSQYRTADDNVLSDLEIEMLLRTWNRNINPDNTMSSAGFIKNLKMNTLSEIR